MPAFLRLTELFHSIQGESTWAGLPCTFIRLTGCPLRCAWCDTEYAFYGGEKVSLDEILARVDAIGTPLVEITGGEPLIHRNAFRLAEMLLDRGYTVLVETSGAVDVSPLDPRVHKIMDLKCPGSGEEQRNLWSNLDHLTERRGQVRHQGSDGLSGRAASSTARPGRPHPRRLAARHPSRPFGTRWISTARGVDPRGPAPGPLSGPAPQGDRSANVPGCDPSPRHVRTRNVSSQSRSWRSGSS